MSGRKVGGGRILGSGRSLSPAAPAAVGAGATAGSNNTGTPPSSSLAATAKRGSALLSPSASTLSLNSTSSTSHTSQEHHQDLTSRISLGPSDGASSSSGVPERLACPICNEQMVTLLQLNRHLDDAHKNLEEVKQDEVKDWFKTQVIKAKKFQPLAVLNQKLKGLDIFESNDTVPTPVPSPSLPAPAGSAAAAAPAAAGGAAPPQSKPREPERIDPDEVVSKAHWQRWGPNDHCSDPMCGKRLNTNNGRVNCRHCGKLFCDEHTMYQMKLSRSAHHEPVRGFWCRVCETCYKSREGYNDHNGLERNHTKEFTALRRRSVDQTLLEVSRLEKRLSRLTQLLANPPEQNASTGGILWPISPMKTQRKELEQSVVTWEEDASVLRCPFCKQEFSTYTFRRHHCRTCGRVVCGDPATGCSTEVALNVATANRRTEKTAEEVCIDIRLCRDCKQTVFNRKDLAAERAGRPPDVRAYNNLKEFEKGITMMLPKFQRLLVALQDPDKPPTPTQLSDATKVRKRLMDSFTQYDVAARRIRDLPTTSETQRRLQRSIFQHATAFLHIYMLPLKSLPKILKHASPNGSTPLPARAQIVRANWSGAHGASSLASSSLSREAAINGNGNGNGTVTSANDDDARTSSSAVSALEEEERALRERLIVLEEQRFFVGEMVAAANKRRRFDEVAALAQNARDLALEIDRVQGMLDQLDFEGAYAGAPSGVLLVPSTASTPAAATAAASSSASLAQGSSPLQSRK